MQGFLTASRRRSRIVRCAARPSSPPSRRPSLGVVVGCGRARPQGPPAAAARWRRQHRPLPRRPHAATPRPAAATCDRQADVDPVPILMYHVIADPPADAPFPELYVSGDDFGGQIAWLAAPRLPRRDAPGRLRLTGASAALPDPPARRLVRRRLPQPVRDGCTDPARPRLARRAEPRGAGTPSGRGGSPQQQVRLLIAAGWELDAHTLTHPDLTKIGAAELRQRWPARAPSSARVRRPGRLLLLPGRKVRRRRGRRGPSRPVTSGRRRLRPACATPSDLFRLKRLRVDRSDGVAGLVAKLHAAGA